MRLECCVNANHCEDSNISLATMYCEQEFYEVPMDSQVLVDKTVIGKALKVT